MAVFRPFTAVRPDARYAAESLCPPYDVVDHDEAAAVISENPRSFMNVTRADAFFKPSEEYSDSVYARSAENLENFIRDGIYTVDRQPHFYIYSEEFQGRTQTGIVGCASIDDYEKGVIKKHEVTKPEKETDRIKHFSACMADTEPVFLTYRDDPEIRDIMEKRIAESGPEYEAEDDEGVTHRLWVLEDSSLTVRLSSLFDDIPAMYIADGHHRTASAVHVGMKLRAEDPDASEDKEYNRFMAVAFPDSDLCVLPYNRLVKNLPGLTVKSFIQHLSAAAEVTPVEDPGHWPTERHTIYIYTGGSWYKAVFRKDLIDETDPVKRLDVSLLQDLVFSPILGIEDPRRDKRLDFSGGIDDHHVLMNAVDTGKAAAAFELCPVTVSEIMDVADSGCIMPPKSTWFEPKLGSGWFVHKIDK